jgi:hypothetical protein
MTLPLGFFYRAAAASGTPLSQAFVTTVVTGQTVNNPHTFAATAIGTASSSRRVVVIASGFADGINAAIATCTVAGQACTRVVTEPVGLNLSTAVFITDDPVTSGTTADIVVSPGASLDELRIGVFTLTGGPPVVYDTLSLRGSTARNGGGLDVLNNGVTFAAAHFFNSGTATWTGATEVYDTDFYTGASLNNSADQTNRTISLTHSSSANSNDVLVAVSFRP